MSMTDKSTVVGVDNHHITMNKNDLMWAMLLTIIGGILGGFNCIGLKIIACQYYTDEKDSEEDKTLKEYQF